MIQVPLFNNSKAGPVPRPATEIRKPEREGQHRKTPLPFLDDQGRLRIPGNCDPKYRYWQKGQSVLDTLLEFGASDTEIDIHVGPVSSPDSWRQWQKFKNERKQC